MIKIIKTLPSGKVTLAVLFLLIQAICDLYIPTLTASMINDGVVVGSTNAILRIGSVMLTFSFVSFAAALLNTYISAKISYKLGNQLREKIYRKITVFSNVEFDRFGASSLITRNTNDVTQVQTLIEMGLKFLILAAIYLIGGLVLSYRLSASLTTSYLVVVPVLLAVAFGIFQMANPLFEKMQSSIDKLNLIFKEGLTGIKVIHAFNKEMEEYHRYESENKTYTKVSIQSNVLLSFLMPFLSLIMSLATIAITWFGAQHINNGTLEIGTLIGVVAYTSQILMGVALIANVVSSIPRGQVSAKRINEVLETPLTVLDGKEKLTVGEEKEPVVSFEQVSFRYPGAEKDVFKNVTFQASKGETLAIIGSTGAGKTTLVNLLARFYEVSGGKIQLFGKNLKKLKQEEIHKEISLVPQRNILFFGTIRENLLKAKPNATDEELWQALDIAQAAEFVRLNEAGLDSAVEKNGGNFSGGQRQRLCLARALLKSSSIYVFDDSFSSLDFKTDAKIRKNLDTHLQEALLIIVAQRISTVRDASQIIVLDHGKIAGVGTHEELAETNPIYQEIIQSQTEQEAA